MIKPLRDLVILKRLESVNTTPGGLFLPETAQQSSNKCKVMAVGPGRQENGKFIIPVVQVGDIVLVSEYAGATNNIEDGMFVCSETDILAVFEKEEK